VVVAAAAVVLVVVLVGMPLSVSRLTTLVARHRSRSARICALLVVLCLAFGATGLRVAPGEPVTSLSASHLAIDHVEAVAADVDEQQKFDAAAATDRFRDETSGGLLSGLRGKDVLVVFVESYGRVALEGSPSSRQLRAMLDSSAGRLSASGYASASAFLTSPTFGGLSWLAHGTLQSGLWVDNQQRYDELLDGNRLTLTSAFGEAGWRTVALLPSNKRDWPRGRHFYKYDKIYDRRDVGYRGPRFGFSKMPDQYALAAFERLELGKRNRPPVMAEIDLASSHTPWAKIPRLVPWNKLGDGSIFNRVQGQQMTVGELWSDPDAVKAAYAKSLAYSMQAVISFVQRSHDRNLAVVLLGDHQPGTVVSGHGGSRDVPVTIIAGREDLGRIADWGWQDGMSPDPKAPVWRMDAFRDRFFAAYSR
jgi:hypothetical protein